MSADAHNPITTKTVLSLPLNGTIYTTTRPVASEKAAPVIGATMAAELGDPYANSRIIAANVIPGDNKNRQEIVHAIIPTEEEQLPSNWEYSTVSIGGRNYPGVTRTVILIASAVAHDAPVIGSAMPAEGGSIFGGKGYILTDRQVVKSGMQLEPVFRVERRNYIIRTETKVISGGSGNRHPLWTKTSIYYKGEIVGGITIEALMIDDANVYWGLQADGTTRVGQKLNDSWYSITIALVLTAAWNTEAKLSLPLNGSVFTSVLPLAIATSIPAIGQTMEALIGVTWADSLIIDVTAIGGHVANEIRITHARIPTEAAQLASNWEYSTCSMGGRTYPSVQRTVVLLAASVAHDTPAIGGAMPVETGSIFTSKGYLLVDRQVSRSGMQLEPVFRVEKRNFIIRSETKVITGGGGNRHPLWTRTTLYYAGEIVTGIVTVEALLADVTHAYWGLQTDGTTRFGQKISDCWYSITTSLALTSKWNTETKLTLPLNGSVFTSVLPLAVATTTPQIGETMEAYIGAGFANSRIIDCTNISGTTANEIRITHAKIPSEADQLVSNWEYSTCSIGGKQFPSVQLTVILLASEVAYNSPKAGDAIPTAPSSIFAGEGYILVDRQVSRSGMQLEPVFRVERRNYILRSTRKTIEVDSLNGKPLWSETTLYYKGEGPDANFAAPNSSYWGLQNNGIQRTGERLSCSWFSITEQLVVAGAYGGGVVTIDSYGGEANFYWPPVLNSIEFMVWPRRDGALSIHPRYVFLPDAYNGPCKFTVTRTWQKDPFTNIEIVNLRTTPINYSSPLFNLRIPSCLHGEIDLVCDIGTSDPIYKPTTDSTRTALATDKTEWPATLRAYDGQVPFRGGFLRTVRIMEAPDTV